MTSQANAQAKQELSRYLKALWLLAKRDLSVRYTTSKLGYLWSVIDPLLMGGIYWFVFTQIIHRRIETAPFIVFLLLTLLPWIWFNGVVSDSTRAFLKDAKLVRSTRIPRTIWVNRIVLAKGVEFLASLPVLIFFVFLNASHFFAENIPYFLCAIVIQLIFTMGIALLIAPLVVFFRDLERAIKLLLRVAFYASPVVYGIQQLPQSATWIIYANPLVGIFGMYRSVFFPEELNIPAALASLCWALVFLVLGIIVFKRCERAVLKEM